MKNLNPNNDLKPIHAKKLFTLVVGIIVLILTVVAIIRLNIRGFVTDEFANIALVAGLVISLILTIAAAYQAVMTIRRREPMNVFKAIGLTGVLFLFLVWLGFISFILIDLTA